MINQTVCITGASSGIGKAIAIEFAKKGYQKLYLTCHTSKEALDSLATELKMSYDVTSHTFAGDIGDASVVSRLFSLMEQNEDTLDILINNAGISHVGLLTDMTLEQWNQILSTNLTSAFLTSKSAIPLMLKKHSGKIINISSVWGICGASCEVAYSTSKGGLNAFTKALAKELAPSGIQVNAIACGAIETRMNGFLDEEGKASLIEGIPANRLGTPREVASFALSLAESPAYLTGEVITFDGGWI